MPKNEEPSKPTANAIEPGDMGIWVTCPLHMKGKAAREMGLLFDEVCVMFMAWCLPRLAADVSQYAEKIYGIKSDEAGANDSDSDEGDIESSIQKEVGSLKNKNKGTADRVFTEIRISQECLLFMRCKLPIEPVEFSRRICQDASSVGHGGAQARYLNRLTPVSVIVKATEAGLEEGARQVLASHFKLNTKGASADSEAPDGKAEAKDRVLDENIRPPTVGPCMEVLAQRTDSCTVRHPPFDPQSQQSQKRQCYQGCCQFDRSSAQSKPWSAGQSCLDRHIPGQSTTRQFTRSGNF